MALVVILVSISSATFKVQMINASGTIYVRANGMIEPKEAPISSVDNITYTLTGNINDLIVVERDSILVDGAGYIVQGTGKGKGISLDGRRNVTIQNVEIIAFNDGIYLCRSSNNRICRNRITANTYIGISLSQSSNNSVVGNNLTANNYDGIMLDLCSNYNNISGNYITANKNDGIDVFNSSNNSIDGNKIVANKLCGVRLSSSLNNSMVENEIKNNYCGVSFINSSKNKFYHNNFINNTQQAWTNSINVWDDGYPSGGNYWSDYAGADYRQGLNQDVNGSDGIGDIECSIEDNNKDRYPLMGTFSDFNATSEYSIQTICNSTISDYQFNGNAISFDVTGNNGTTGFCRICIPTSLMNGTYHVFVNSTEVSYSLLSCSNETYSYLYFNYTHSTQEVIIIPEFPSFLILSLFMIVTLLAVIVYKRKHSM